MTNEHKDLPALPGPQFRHHGVAGKVDYFTANQMRAIQAESYYIGYSAALAARPEPAGAGVESVDNTAFMGRAIAAAVEAMDVGPGGEWDSFVAHIDAHVAAQVAKARLAPKVKDHVLAAVVNKLRDTAIQFHAAGQLRQRLCEAISPLIGGGETTPQAQQPVASVASVDDAHWTNSHCEYEVCDEAENHDPKCVTWKDDSSAPASDGGATLTTSAAPAPDAVGLPTFENWCATKGLTPSKCDDTNIWIRYAFEGGLAALGIIKYKTAPAPDAGARDVALEEAAKVCDFHATWSKGEAEESTYSESSQKTFRTQQFQAEKCAEAIRALKTVPAKPQGGTQ